MPVTRIQLEDYQKPAFEVDSLELCFELYEEQVVVESLMHVRALGEQRVLCLDGEELVLLKLELDGKELTASDYELTPTNLLIPEVPSRFSLRIVTQIKPQNNTQLSGLYRSHTMFCTQCEAQGFRRITYFLDRPDVMTVYTTKIVADKVRYPVLLSNGNPVDHGDLADGRHWITWKDPFRKPSYLFALVAGDLVAVHDSFTTSSNRCVDLRIYVEQGNEDKCAHAMQSLKNAMRWDEQQYGREYDLDIFMIVAVSDFNMGAMENKGLNIFNSKYILARPETATDNDYAGIEGVVAHEYFHNWTGNRITCRDWFQLSLKEGLTVFRDQEFSRDMNSRDVNRIQDIKILRTAQFAEDAGPTAHPVRPESYMEINNFYTATIYNKGAEVIRMQQTILGESGFRKGMDLYFNRHDGQAVTIDDFVACMSDANAVDFSQFMHWYNQAGTPEVAVKVDYDADAQCLSLQMEQSCRPSAECAQKKPYVIPIRFALWSQTGKRLPLDNDVLLLTEACQRFEWHDMVEKPIVSLLRDFSAPVNLSLEYDREELQTLMRVETDGFARWEASQRLAMNYLVELIAGNVNVLTVALAETYRAILDEGHDYSLTAELLTPPSFDDIVRQLTQVDVDKVLRARKEYLIFIGTRLYAQFERKYHALHESQSAQMDTDAFALRKLQNVCLKYMMEAKPEQTYSLCLAQYHTAKTMTDSIASLSALVNQAAQQSQLALSEFYERWKQDELVLDKWFSIQAMSQVDSCLEQVKKLMTHEAFSLKNPNKVRALIGAFAQSNPKCFHHISGKGYEFLAEQVLNVDKFNPQIAARLVMPLLRWRSYDDRRQELLKAQLKSMLKQDLSNDLYEMLSRSVPVDS